MSHLRRCTACGTLTMLQHCPKCHRSTSTYINSLPFDQDICPALGYTAPSPRVCVLTKGDPVQYSSTDHALNLETSKSVSSGSGIRSELKSPTEFNEDLNKSTKNLVQENMALHHELREDKAQMMQSALEILSLHDSNNAARRSSLELIERLLSDIRKLGQQQDYLGSPLVEGGDSNRLAQIPAIPEAFVCTHQNPLEIPDIDSRVSSSRDISISGGSQLLLTKAQEEITRLRALLETKNSKIYWVAEQTRKAEETLDTLMVNLNAAEATTQAGAKAYENLNLDAITDRMDYGGVNYSLSPSLVKCYEKLLKR